MEKPWRPCEDHGDPPDQPDIGGRAYRPEPILHHAGHSRDQNSCRPSPRASPQVTQQHRLEPRRSVKPRLVASPCTEVQETAGQSVCWLTDLLTRVASGPVSAGSNPSVRFWERNGSGQPRACVVRCGQLDHAQWSKLHKPPGPGQQGGSAWLGDPGRLCDSGGARGAEYRGRDSNRSRAARASQQ